MTLFKFNTAASGGNGAYLTLTPTNRVPATKFRSFLFTITLIACAVIPGEEACAQLLGTKSIVYTGKITPEGVAKVKSSITAEIGTIEITSSGGDERASLELAELVQERRLAVVVRGICLSGCATALIASQHRVLLDNAIIGLHSTSLTLGNAYRSSGNEVPAYYPDFNRRYETIFKSVGADIEILREASRRIEVTDRSVESTNPYTGEKGLGFLSVFQMWMPSDSELARYGIEVHRIGVWPKSPAERTAQLKKFGVDPRTKFIWGR